MPAGWLEQGAHAVRGALALGLGPWGGAGRGHRGLRGRGVSASTAQQDAARAVGVAPARSILALSADLTRDVGAVQASAARWVLDA